MFDAPPPPPPVADRVVVAGPVLAASRMLWVEDREGRLVVQAQRPDGGIGALGVFEPPGEGVQQRVESFAASGRRVALVRSARRQVISPGCSSPPCTPKGGPPPPPFMWSLDRLGAGRRSGVSSRERCALPEMVGWTSAGLVTQRCEPTRIELGGRLLASGGVRLIGARGPWVAWQRGSAITARRVSGRRQRYSVALSAGQQGAAVDEDGTVAIVATAGTADPCNPGNVQPLSALSLATPDRRIRQIATRVAGPVAVAAGQAAFGVLLDGCPRSYQLRVGRRPIDAAGELPFQLDFDGREIAIRRTNALSRHRVARRP